MGTLASHDVVFGRRHDIIDMMPEGCACQQGSRDFGNLKNPEKNKKLVLEPEPEKTLDNTEVESPPHVRICNCNSYAS